MVVRSFLTIFLPLLGENGSTVIQNMSITLLMLTRILHMWNEDHLCGSTGIEDVVKNFGDELEEDATNDPTQPFPPLYQRVRARFTQKLSYDHKLLFLAQIPSYDSMTVFRQTCTE